MKLNLTPALALRREDPVSSPRLDECSSSSSAEEEAPSPSTGFRLNLRGLPPVEVDDSRPVAVPHTPKETIAEALCGPLSLSPSDAAAVEAMKATMARAAAEAAREEASSSDACSSSGDDDDSAGAEVEAVPSAPSGFRLNLATVQRDDVDGTKPVAVPHTPKGAILEALQAAAAGATAGGGGGAPLSCSDATAAGGREGGGGLGGAGLLASLRRVSAIPIDTTGDGRADAWAIDSTADGRLDTLVAPRRREAGRAAAHAGPSPRVPTVELASSSAAASATSSASPLASLLAPLPPLPPLPLDSLTPLGPTGRTAQAMGSTITELARRCFGEAGSFRGSIRGSGRASVGGGSISPLAEWRQV